MTGGHDRGHQPVRAAEHRHRPPDADRRIVGMGRHDKNAPARGSRPRIHDEKTGVEPVDSLLSRDARGGTRVGDKDHVPVPLQDRDGYRGVEGPFREALDDLSEVAPGGKQEDPRRPREVREAE